MATGRGAALQAAGRGLMDLAMQVPKHAGAIRSKRREDEDREKKSGSF